MIPRRGEGKDEVLATKVSGLAVDSEYVFQLVLRTSAGTYSSEKLTVRTHKMTDLTGITVTPGVLPPPLRESLVGAVDRIGAKFVGEGVRIDTTHFVCTEGRGREWEKAVEMNIPVVRPEWVEGCEREGRIVGVRGYYLNADPRLRQVGQGAAMQQQGQRPMQQQRMDSQRTVPVQQPQTPSQPQSAGLPPPEPAETPGSNSEDSRGPPPPLPEKDQPVGQEGARGEDMDGTEKEEEESEEESEEIEKGEKGEKVMEADGDIGVPREGEEEENGKEEAEDEQGEGEGFDEVKL